MVRLKILASEESQQPQKRGKLFEQLMAEVLKHYGYHIDQPIRVNYAGMEIDVEGKHSATGIPMYAECKCWEREVDSPALQAFWGKYMAKWFKEKRSHGLFIALPGVNSYAMGFYKDYIESNNDVTVRLYQEINVLDAIQSRGSILDQDAIARFIKDSIGKPGDSYLLYTDRGLFWVQLVIPQGAGIPTQVALFDGKGDPITDKSTADYLMLLYPTIKDLEWVTIGGAGIRPKTMHENVEQIVKVTGSSECFEYQFPASPEHFVGRQMVLNKLDSFVEKVIKKQTSCRGILFQANSGWGKSSVILACVNRLQKMGHFAIAIDSRTALSVQFILRVIEYALKEFGDLGGILRGGTIPQTITGFEGAMETLLRVGKSLEAKNKVMFIFLDQFENIFSLTETLRPITDLLLRISDAQSGVVLGFAWKTDLIGSTHEFPYILRDNITAASERIDLDTFSDVETIALLNKLSQELGKPLRKDLEFFLSEFSQGYPWLLKKLCAHVKSQRESGVPQSEIANSLLNIEQLFHEDLRGLSSEDEEVLRRISKVAPVSISELSDDLRPEVVQSLVNRRLLVKIGTKLDVYWDIFRDYLNSSSVPIQENYILRTSVGSVLTATKLLVDSKSALKMSEFQTRFGRKSKQSLYNVARDMRLIGLAEVSGGKVILQIKFPPAVKNFQESFRAHLRERLPRNRLVRRLMDTLDEKATLTLGEVSRLIAEWCPYISASTRTWETYGRTFAVWMDAADLAIYDPRESALNRYTPGTELRERQFRFAKRRGGEMFPSIQYTPVISVATRIMDAVSNKTRIDWTGLSKSTIAKSLAALEDLGFLTRKANTITITTDLHTLVYSSDKRNKLFSDRALRMNSFTAFIEILNSHKEKAATLQELAVALVNRLKLDWKLSTAETTVKIMLDWARHTNLAPGVFAKIGKGPKKGWKTKRNEQPSFL